MVSSIERTLLAAANTLPIAGRRSNNEVGVRGVSGERGACGGHPFFRGVGSSILTVGWLRSGSLGSIVGMLVKSDMVEAASTSISSSAAGASSWMLADGERGDVGVDSVYSGTGVIFSWLVKIFEGERIGERVRRSSSGKGSAGSGTERAR